MMDSSEASTGRATIGAGQLHTPQEPLLDSFSQQHNDKIEEATSLKTGRTVQTHSPPASPQHRADDVIVAHDSPLYDEPRKDSAQSDVPLFDSEGDSQLTDAPATKPSAREASPHPVHPLLKGVTNLGKIIGPSVFIHPSPEGALAYFNARMAEVYRIRAAQLPKPTKSSAAAPRDPETARQLRLVDQSAKVTKIRSPPKAAARPRATKATPAAPATPSRAASPEQTEAKPLQPGSARRSRTPRTKTYDDFIDDASDKKHKRAAPSKQTATKDDDLRWREMPDYAPPLPATEKPYGVAWKGSRLDNSGELDFDELSAAEKEACAILRLRPVQWLANKRRIFGAKLVSVREGEKFTRTKAQIAGNIDVNKTTQMFEAFERFGWLEEKWFEHLR